MSTDGSAALALFTTGCALCVVLGFRESRRAGDRRLPYLAPRGRLRGFDLVLFALALACVVPAGVLFARTGSPALTGSIALVLGLGVPYVAVTAAHNRRVRRAREPGGKP